MLGYSTSVASHTASSGLFGALGRIIGKEVSCSSLLGRRRFCPGAGLSSPHHCGSDAYVPWSDYGDYDSYLWLLFGSIGSDRKLSMAKNNQPKRFGVNANAKDVLAFEVDLVMVP